uniref:Taste receptor type 2 n=1 Tax=Leptobrachium leishanense TaxID=445787 RepID=A0A8C5R820_9ANUR
MDQIIEILLNGIEFIILGVSGSVNMFIFIVNLIDLIKNKTLLVTDQLIFGISSINLLFCAMKPYTFILAMKRSKSVNSDIADMFTWVIMLSRNCCNLWLSDLICLHFCFKLVNFKQKIYIYLQQRFHKMFPWIFLPIILVSCLVTIPLYFNKEMFSQNDTFLIKPEKRSYYFFIPYIAVTALGCILNTFSAMMILISLCKHIRKMKQGSIIPNMNVHINAAKIVSCMLILNNLSFAMFISVLLYDNSKLFSSGLILMSYLFIFIASLNIVKGSNKLAKKLNEVKALLCLKSCQ